jgi:hypothetical protein
MTPALLIFEISAAVSNWDRSNRYGAGPFGVGRGWKG